jgi:MoaA/NifB/PqqE/SkfB family radical SAM enzyme
VPAHVWSDVIDDLVQMRVKSVVYSGIYSDPLCVEERLLVSLLQKGGPYWGVKLYTYGLRLTQRVREAIVQAALDGPADSSYIRFSKPTVDPKIAEEMCRPRRGIDGRELLRMEEANLEALFDLAAARAFPLEISLNCRVTRLNGDPHALADLLRWLADTPARVQLRFTTDYEPTGATTSVRSKFRALYVGPKEAWQRIRAAIQLARFQELDRLSFRTVAQDSRCNVPRCLNRLLFSAISTEGRVYPCQGVAARRYEHLAYGDVQDKRFREIWSDFTKSLADSDRDPIGQGCPHSAAAGEVLINQSLAADSQQPPDD